MVCANCHNSAVNHSQQGIPYHLYENDAPEVVIPHWQEYNHLPGALRHNGAVPEGHMYQVNDPASVYFIWFLIYRCHIYPSLEVFYLYLQGTT